MVCLAAGTNGRQTRRASCLTARSDQELFHESDELLETIAHQVRTDFARMNATKPHPLLELRFTNRKEFARALEIHITAEIINSRKLFSKRITDRSNQQLVWNINA